MRTAICAIVRDEARGLLEWVAYHRVIGFDEVTIYDNESADSTTNICERLSHAGAICHRMWPDPPADFHMGPQVLAYEHAVVHTQADWLCFLDADEFLVLEQADSVGSFISIVGAQGMPIALNWRIFGSSGERLAGAGLVTDRFVRCGCISADVNRHIKTLGPRSILDKGARVHVHGWVLERSDQYYVNAVGERVAVEGCTFVSPPCWRGAWVNHYIVKSQEEFEAKRRRGKATERVNSPTKYDRDYSSYFIPYDRNEEEDRTIQRFRPQLTAEINRLESIVNEP